MKQLSTDWVDMTHMKEELWGERVVFTIKLATSTVAKLGWEVSLAI